MQNDGVWARLGRVDTVVSLIGGVMTIGPVGWALIQGGLQAVLPVWAVAIVAVGAALFGYLLGRRTNAVLARKTPEGRVIRYRAVIKLIHETTRRALHSHAISYKHPGSSNQQQVTAFGSADPNDYWIVKGPHGHADTYRKGDPIQNGSLVRLEHQNTRKNLHSHREFRSPVTEQQEVTAFSPTSNGVGDTNDDWYVEVDDLGVWREDVKVRLIHRETNVALHSHANNAHRDFTAGQQEVTGFASRDENDWWRAVIVQDVDAA